MDIIESMIETSSKEYKKNYSHYEKFVKNLKEHIAIAAKGGARPATLIDPIAIQVVERYRMAVPISTL